MQSNHKPGYIAVNGVEITEDAIGREMQYHPAASGEQAWLTAAQSLAVRELLRQRAIELGLVEDEPLMPEQEETTLDNLLQQEVSVPEADQLTCRRYYQSHPQAFIDKVSGKRLEYQRVEPWVKHYLHTRAMRAAVSEYIKTLVQRADVQGLVLTNAQITIKGMG